MQEIVTLGGGGHKEDSGVTPETCGVIGERNQVILVWVRATCIENASHP
jgi:hypothetical protein